MALTALLEPVEVSSSKGPGNSSGTSPAASSRRNHTRVSAPKTPQLLPLSVTASEEESLTLNQASTGVPLYHGIQLFWGHRNPTAPLRLTLKNPPSRARVMVNDKQTCYGCLLKEGDILSFKSMDGVSYKYKIRITEGDADSDHLSETDATTAALPSSSPTRTPRKRAATSDPNTASTEEPLPSSTQPPLAADNEDDEDVTVDDPPTTKTTSQFIMSAAAEEFFCVICMEIQVQSTTLVPCGHSLCLSCIPSSPLSSPTKSNSTKVCSCPTCRTLIQQQVPNRLVDNAIAALTRISHGSGGPSFFKPDDVSVYRARTEKIKAEAAAAAACTSSSCGSAAKQPKRAKRQRRQDQQHQARVAVHQPPGASHADVICIDLS